MKKLLLFAVILFFCPACFASNEGVRLISVYFFANVLFEVNDEAGRSIKLSSPLMEYRRLEKWNASEVSLSPSMVDIVTLLESEVEDTGVIVNIVLYEEVGPLIINEEYGVTDVDAGAKLASWQERSSLRKSFKVPVVAAGETKTIVFKNVNLRKIIDRRYTRDEWPYRIKVVVSISCASCRSNNVTEVLKITPGD